MVQPEKDKTDISDRRFVRVAGLAVLSAFLSFLIVNPFIKQIGLLKIVPAVVGFLVFMALMYWARE